MLMAFIEEVEYLLKKLHNFMEIQIFKDEKNEKNNI